YASGNYQNSYDPDNDGFSNLGKSITISLNPKIFLYPSEKTIIWVGLNGTFDDRTGGDMKAIKNGVSSDHPYLEENISSRASTQAVLEHKFTDKKMLTFKNSISYF